jgi:hypothetical protein
MHTFCRFSVWCMTETKNFACLFVDPLLSVFNAIFALRFHILRVSLRDIFLGGALRKIMNVHVQRHSGEILARYYAMQNADVWRVAERLVNDAIALRQSNQCGELFFAGIGIQVEV